MNDADLDLILGIANGRLTGRARQDALDRIAADPELGEELATQITAMHGLSALEPAHMTPSEKAALRSSLIEQLHLESATPVAKAATPRRPWWQFALASAAALLVAIVVVPSMLPGSDDNSADVVAISPEATESVETGAEGGESNADGEAKTESTSSGASAQERASTFALPHITEDGIQEFFEAPPTPVNAVPTTVADDLAPTVAEDTADETIASSASSFATPTEVAVDRVQIEECLAVLDTELDDGELIPMAATPDGDVTTIHFGVDSVSGIEYSVSIELETCTITSTTP